MADLVAGETFADGGAAVTGARLNNHVNGATIDPAFISAKALVTPVAGDHLLIRQAGSGLLKKATVGSVAIGGFLQTAVQNPAGTTSATGVMMGLGATQVFTPLTTGRLLIILNGNVYNTVINDGVQLTMRYGTGASPVNGAAVTGTLIGHTVILSNEVQASSRFPFTCSAIISGLTLSTAIWFDLAVARLTGGTATVEQVAISVIEL
jgi:hypothetical protein